ncbi:MAG: hypothetical protein Q9218_001321 [Villophora microphyllina]
MVVIFELDDDSAFDPYGRPKGLAGLQKPYFQEHIANGPNSDDDIGKPTVTEGEDRPNPNINGFSAALGCYPIVTQLTQYIDLNTLHALARTCRQFRANLLQYRTRLVQQSLHCENEGANPIDRGVFNFSKRTTLASGRVGPCARDLVSDCRRCGCVICRNCAHKPPSASRLYLRHRRLCRVCLATPLPQLSRQWQDPCTCPSSVYLCSECGKGLKAADTDYRRLWEWRIRYSTKLGGLGTGIGEGNEGVQCCRGGNCKAAKEVDVEVDSLDEPRVVDREALGAGDKPFDFWEETEEREERAGYLQQEIEGVGGRLKKFYKKRTKVGKTVREWEDERDGKETVLGRESRGEARSWCGWCGRVIWGKKDRQEFSEGRETGAEEQKIGVH